MPIKIKGTIINNSDKDIYNWCDMESTSPNDVEKGLNLANGLDVEVEINSGGGDLYAGSEIYTMLKSYKGTVRINITGVAGSSASIIAMAGDIVKMTPTGQLMIHNVWTFIRGDSVALKKEAEVLEGHNEGVANAYMLKTGKDRAELLSLMEKESYFNAREALEHGFIDEILFDVENKVAASLGSGMLPTEVVNKIRNVINEQRLESDNENIINKQKELKARINLLKLMEIKN